MSNLLSNLLGLWLILFVIAGANALVRKTTGRSLMEAIGIAWIISRIIK